MKSIRDLANETSSIVNGVIESGKPEVITKHGRPVAILSPLDPAMVDEILSTVLAERTAE